MLAELQAAASLLVTVKDMASALVRERDGEKAAAIKIDFTQKIIELQTQFLEVQGSVISKDGLIHSLSQRVRDLEAEQHQKARYHLAKLGVGGDFFAYQLRPAAELSERTDEPPHFACQPCLDVRKHLSLLQRIDINGRPYQYECWECRAQIPLAD